MSPRINRAVASVVFSEPLETRRLFAVLTVNSFQDNNQADATLTLREAISIVNGSLGIAALTDGERAQINLTQPLGSFDTIDFNLPGTTRHELSITSALPALSKPVKIDGYSQPGSAPATSGTPAKIGITLIEDTAGNTVTGFLITSQFTTIRGLSLLDFGGSAIRFDSGSGNDTVAGNWIGIGPDVNFSASEYSPNSIGIDLAFTGDNRIGGTTPADRNVISYNVGAGIALAFANNNVIEGNYIGTDPTGTQGVRNLTGIEIALTSSGNVIGGTTGGARNVISNNQGDGIYIHGHDNNNNTIEGNYIGTNAAGTAALGNGANGVAIDSSGVTDNSTFTIGGDLPSDRNVISGNHGSGVSITNVGPGVHVNSNYIGLSADGKSGIGNDEDGIFVNNARPFIGTTVAGAGNVISGNGLLNNGDGLLTSGIAVEGAQSYFAIYGNKIGTNAAGTAVIGNKRHGIYAVNNNNLVIGNAPDYERNVISGNAYDGVRFEEENDATVINDYIGVLADGKTPAGNGFNGVGIFGSSSYNGVGGINLGCVIANNGGDGVEIADVPTGNPVHNIVIGNAIYNNGALGIDLVTVLSGDVETGVTVNDTGDADTGPNDKQNFPVITTATYTAGKVTVLGTLSSTPNTAFNVDLYGSDKADASGYGEGRQYLGTVAVTTNGSGYVSFSSSFNVAVGSNTYLSSTATTASGFGETSEFSKTFKAFASVPAPSVSINDVTKTEGNSGTTAFTFTLTRTGDLTRASAVIVNTANGTATSGSDYGALVNRQVNFAIGQSTATISVPVGGDKTVEPNETFFVNVTNSTNAIVSHGQGVGTIVNDDSPATTGSISGFAFDDKNKNGVFDTGDNVASGKTIYLDLDDDGVKDSNEPTVTTDSAGKFNFTGLAARSYHVRRVFSAGYKESTPARRITLTAGQSVTGVGIGSKAG